MNIKLILLSWACVCLSGLTSAQGVYIGANIDGIADYGRSHAFVDLVKQSRAFGLPDKPWVADTGLPTLDANGWPSSDFGVILWIDTLTNMTGTYKMSFECETNATVSFVASTGKIQNYLFNPTTKTATADMVVPPGQTQTFLSFINTKSGVRNLKVIRPGYNITNTPVFTTAFTNHYQQFNTLRFMDWARTNGNPVSKWSQRTKPTSPSMTNEPGVAWEYMIALVNQLKVNMWINVPHQADDDYVFNLATLVKSSLNPTSNVYVEYSNEIWNWQFSQTHWALQQAISEVNAIPTSNLNYDQSNNQGLWHWRYCARRAMQVVKIFKDVFGTSSSNRIKGVFAAQLAYPDGMLNTGLKFINDNYASPSQYFSVIAGAPYFNLVQVDVAENLTVNLVLSALNKSVNAYRTDYNMLKYAFLGAYYGMPVVAYEGGPDTFGPFNIQAKKQASQNTIMGSLCKSLLDIWFSYGFGLFNWFVGGATTYDTRYGTWGLAEVMSNLSTPKALAIKNYITANTASIPSITIGVPVPGAVDARQSVSGNYFNWQNQKTPAVYRQSFIDYLIRTTSSAGLYYLVLNVSTAEALSQIRVDINNKLIGTVNVFSTKGLFIAQNYLSVNLTTGLSGVRLTCLNGSFSLASLSFSNQVPAPVMTSWISDMATPYVPYTYQVTATNYPTSYSAANLPIGLTINSSTGLITGKPTVSGNFTINVTIFNSGNKATYIIKLIVLSALLLRESFEYPVGKFHNANGGIGFSAAWVVQNFDVTQYSIASTNLLKYSTIKLYGNYTSGGGNYLTTGRAFDLNGRFLSFLDAGGNIGADNRTLWLSLLIRKETSTSDQLFVCLHASSWVTWANGNTRIALGYFGKDSEFNGQKYWSLKYADNMAVRGGPNSTINANVTTLLVMRMDFNPGLNNDQVSLFVNPSLTGQAPTIPNVQISGANLAFRYLVFYGGSSASQGALDEIHIGSTYSSVIETV